MRGCRAVASQRIASAERFQQPQSRCAAATIRSLPIRNSSDDGRTRVGELRFYSRDEVGRTVHQRENIGAPRALIAEAPKEQR